MTSYTSTPPPTSSSTINDDKLSGQLIIKAQLGNDIRKMMIHNEDLTLNELVLMMERIFIGKISNSDELTIKYLDDDGDKITLSNDSDLTVALHFHKLLRLFVFVNGKEPLNKTSTDKLNKDESSIDANTVHNELQELRSSVQTILDRLQLPTSTAVSNTYQSSTTPDNTRSNSNHLANNEHQAAPTVDTQQVHVESADVNKTAFQQTQMPTPHFVPPTSNNNQQAKTNVFGPPPTAFHGMPPLPNSSFPPVTTPNGNTPPPLSVGHQAPPSAQQGGFNAQQAPPPAQQGNFYGQQAPPPAHQGGFYSQQQNLYQPRPPVPNFHANNVFPPQQAGPPSPSSSPATINPSYAQAPPMASQQPYGGYPPQNSYYNTPQQYPKTS